MDDEFLSVIIDGDEVETWGQGGDVDLAGDGGEKASLDGLAEGGGDGVMRNSECGIRNF